MHSEYVFQPVGTTRRVTCRVIELADGTFDTLFSHRPQKRGGSSPFLPPKASFPSPEEALEYVLRAYARYVSDAQGKLTWVRTDEI